MALYIVEIDLNKKSPMTIENGDTIMDKGRDTVTVRNVEASSDEDAQAIARGKANLLFDELSFLYETRLELKSSLTIGKQDSPETRHIRRYIIKTYTTGGHRYLPPRKVDRIDIKPAEAKTYYRAALMASNPFDEFRNYFLAIENVASNKEFMYVPKEGLDYVTDAIQKCFSSDEDKQGLIDHAHARGFMDTGNIYKDVSDFLYQENRIQLNHAKAEEPKKVPFRDQDLRAVEGASFLAEYVAKKLIAFYDSNLRSA